MRTFSSELVQFIVLILPGFLALFVYRPFVYHGGTTDAGEMDITKAMLFGLPGYFVSQVFFSQLWSQMLISVVISLIFGCVWGLVRRKWEFWEYLPAKCHSEKNEITKDTHYQSALEFLYRECFEKCGKECTQVAFVYNMTNPDIVQSGEIISWGTQTHDINIGRSPFVTKEDLNRHINKVNQWQKIINLDTGIVLEVANVENSVLESLYNKQADSNKP